MPGAIGKCATQCKGAAGAFQLINLDRTTGERGLFRGRRRRSRRSTRFKINPAPTESLEGEGE